MVETHELLTDVFMGIKSGIDGNKQQYTTI
jgi:hypothetical protein